MEIIQYIEGRFTFDYFELISLKFIIVNESDFVKWNL